MAIRPISNRLFAIGVSFLLLCQLGQAAESLDADQRYQAGKKIYTEGMLPSGEYISAVINGDIKVSGDQLICESCHRRSGMGTLEGQQVVPAIAGHVLFSDLQLPTSQHPSTPIQRPAYTRETLKLAVTQGIDANGRILDPFMPRYNMSDEDLDSLIVYLNQLSDRSDPGVDDNEIHFATIIHEDNPAAVNKALLGVMEAYFEQKNSESRHETTRSEHAPWHKEWIMKTYRKWRLHVWTLKGEPESWPEQLQSFYQQQPVFAVLNGYVEGDFKPIHQFCEANTLPCLFPTTAQPVLDEKGFYTFYMDRGDSFEGEALAAYLNNQYPQQTILQIVEAAHPSSNLAAEGLRKHLSGQLDDQSLGCTANDPQAIDIERMKSVSGIVIFMSKPCTDNLLKYIAGQGVERPIFLSTHLYGETASELPESLKSRVQLVHTKEMPDLVNRRLARSTGWLRYKKIYDPNQKEVQANVYFALKVAGDSLMHIRGYFFRDYLLERIEHTIDNVPYTSVYPRLSLAPGQRFSARGYFMTRFDRTQNKLVNLTEWQAP